MLYFTGSRLFPHCTQGKELLYLIVVNHLMNSAAHDGPLGHFSKGSIKLRPLGCCIQMSTCAVLALEKLLFAPLISIVSLAKLKMRPLISGCLEEGVFAIHSFIHSWSLAQVASLGHPLI